MSQDSKQDLHMKLLSTWGWKMAQSVKCLLCKYEDLSVDPQHTCVVSRIAVSQSWEVETDPWNFWPASQDEMGEG